VRQIIIWIQTHALLVMLENIQKLAQLNVLNVKITIVMLVVLPELGSVQPAQPILTLIQPPALVLIAEKDIILKLARPHV